MSEGSSTNCKKRSRENKGEQKTKGPKRHKPESKDEYAQLTDREHALQRPDTYYGSVFPETRRMWTRPVNGLLSRGNSPAAAPSSDEFQDNKETKVKDDKDNGAKETKDDKDKDNGAKEDKDKDNGAKKTKAKDKDDKSRPTLLAFHKMVWTAVTFVPAFFKMFDEVLVNALDNFSRTRSGYRHSSWDKDEPVPKMTELRVEIDRSKGRIRIWNNGKAIPVRKHKDNTKLYVPTMIFGEMRTSNNLDDEEERITGGRNGYGAKLANIGSTKFIVRINDKYRKLSFHQTWRKNMEDRDDPIVEKNSESDSTEVTFYPDFEWLHMPNGLDDDTLSLLEKRVWDAAATCDGLQVVLNGTTLPKFGFAEYPLLFVPDHWDSVMKKLPYKTAHATVNKLERERMAELERMAQENKQIKTKSKSTRSKSSESKMDEGEEEEDDDRDWREDIKVLRDSDDRRYELVLVPNPMDDDGGGGGTKEEQHMTFVNNIWTITGGTHVQHVMEPLVAALKEALSNHRRMKDVKLPPKLDAFVAQHWFVFLRTTLINPAFDTQSKVRLCSQFKIPLDDSKRISKRKDKDGSKSAEAPKLDPIVLTPAFCKRFAKGPFLQMVVDHCLHRHMTKNLKASDGSKQLRKKPKKLEDADRAGSKDSAKCSLFLTEGDSAKNLVMAGFKEIGRDFYGVFPLRGKFINVRDVKITRLEKNAEFFAIKQALGLKTDVEYKTEEERAQLRYGKIILMTDRDHDGSHIAGLIINLFAHFWPALLNDYIQLMLTPVIRITRGRKTQYFYQHDAYLRWQKENNNGKGWHVKYYKGLGTSTNVEAQEYFSNLDDLLVQFNIRDRAQDLHQLEIAFNKKRAKARKEMVGNYDPEQCPPLKYGEGLKTLSFAKWVMRDYIHYMMAANERHIPNLMDGQKPVQRKVLYALLDRKSNPEQKVPSAGGYIIEKAAYHHGEESLHVTMVKMAQTYVGSNNINWLVPSGQFGSRPQLGDDFAAPRYLNTRLTEITRLVFLPRDDALCTPQYEDGQKIQPECLYPILPTVLINGVEGMGCGWRTDIPAFNPADIIANLRKLLRGESAASLSTLHPYCRGYRGSILRKDGSDSVYVVHGVVRFVDPDDVDKLLQLEDREEWKTAQEDAEFKLRITEVPFLISKDKYETILDGLKAKGEIVRWKSDCKGEDLTFTLTLTATHLRSSYNMGGDDLDTGLMTYLSLVSYLYVSGIVCFNPQHKIQRYSGPNEVLTEFYKYRLQIYEKSRLYHIRALDETCLRLRNLIRFRKCLQTKEIVLQNQSDAQMLHRLKELKFDEITKDDSTVSPASAEAVIEPPVDEDDDEKETKDSPNDKADTKSAQVEAHEGDDEDAELSKEEKSTKAGYQYLLSQNLWSLGRKKSKKEEKDLAETEAKLAALRVKSATDMWNEDLDNLEPALERHNKKWLVERENPKRNKKNPSAKDSGKGKNRKKTK